MNNKLYYGAAYYPELWDAETMEKDIREMKKVGINAVRMAEFAWAAMEPEEDAIDVSFFSECICKLRRNGIDTVLCTPTPTPPIWMSHGHPERMFVNEEGERMIHGARQHVCTNHPYMRSRSRKIVEAMAKSLGSLPGVIAWQTDNEFKCHVGECLCKTCEELWHEWLEKRYGTIERLNQAWGTMIWSQRYQRFDQIPQPFKTTFFHNASLSTMYRIFSREKITEYQKEQTDIIRRYSEAPVTHNTNLGFRLDQEKLFADLDFFSFDSYESHEQYHRMLMMYDLGRGVKRGKSFWVMETSPAHNGCLSHALPTYPDGYIKAESLAAYALGAQGFSYWLWRQQRTGCELQHSAVLSAWGSPAVGYRSVCEAAQARLEIEEMLLSTEPVPAPAALTYSDSASIFFQTEALEHLGYKSLLDEYYRRVSDAGIYRDVIFENASVDGYRMVLSPFMPYLSENYLDKMGAFVREGGIWIAGPVTGGRTGEHTVHTDHALGRLEELAGVETTATFSLSHTGTQGEAFGQQAPLGLWSSLFKCREAVPKGIIRGHILDGSVFVTERALGKGKIVLIGAWPVEEAGKRMTQTILKHYAEEAGIVHPSWSFAGTVTVPRRGVGEKSDQQYLIAVNMDGLGGDILLQGTGLDCVSGERLLPGKHPVAAYGYRAIELV